MMRFGDVVHAKPGLSFSPCAKFGALWTAVFSLATPLLSHPALAAEASQVNGVHVSAGKPRQASMEPFWARRITGYLTTRDGAKLRWRERSSTGSCV